MDWDKLIIGPEDIDVPVWLVSLKVYSKFDRKLVCYTVWYKKLYISFYLERERDISTIKAVLFNLEQEITVIKNKKKYIILRPKQIG